MTEILHQLEAGEGEFFDLWKETRQWSIDSMEHAYDWAEGPDAWYWESDDAASMAYAREMFAKGVLGERSGSGWTSPTRTPTWDLPCSSKAMARGLPDQGRGTCPAEI
ncbi:MAG: hypothetical protein U0176_23035 [Bacteroidia bacterium]